VSDPVSETRDRLTASLAGDYVIERELGQGGMATVYLAHDVRHDRRVALKVLRPELAAVIGAARFLQEIRTVANLQHPHILPLFDSGDVSGTVYYVMPYIEGESLRDRLTRERQLPIDHAIRLASEVASALDYAHRRGVLHRDIKPENILLHEGQALVSDFGIALAVARSDNAPRLTETGMSLGTPHYMSPEQAMGERTLDARTDIYSLGCVVYEMLAGEPPFTGPSAQAIIARVVTEDPRPLRTQRRTIPPHVEAAVYCALEKLPADRFATAGQFAEALTAPGAGTIGAIPAHRAVPAAGTASARRVAREWGPWVLTAGAVLLAVAAWFARAEPPELISEHRIALWQHRIAPGALARNLAISADGSLLVYVDTVGGVQQLWLKRRESAMVSPIIGTAGATVPAISYDGTWIAFLADGRLRKVPVAGGPPITLVDSLPPTMAVLTWQDDGTVLFGNPGVGLAIVDGAGTERRVVPATSLRARAAAAVTALPGSRAALLSTCTFGCPDPDLRVLDLQTGELRLLAQDVVKGWYLPSGHLVYVRTDGAVFAVPFDLRQLAMRGPPVTVMEGVRSAFGEADMVLAPGGTMIYVPGRGANVGQQYQAALVSRDGASAVIDSAWSFTPAGNGGVAVSPDGRRLAISLRASDSDDIWIRDLATGTLMRLTFGGFNIRPEWSADGRTVFYVATPPEAQATIKARRSDGAGDEEDVLSLDRSVLEIARTGDTSAFLVRLGSPPSRDILLWRRGAGPDSLLPLVAAAGFDEIAPALSPDGRWLAYVSNESGRNEVYVRPFPQVSAGRWQLSRTGGAEPNWSHNGRELFYRDPGGDLIAVPVSTDAAFTPGAPRVLFSSRAFRAGASRHESYDVTPDGRFVFMRQLQQETPTEAAPLIYVENWLPALQAAQRRRGQR
jgi:eukaryotic-like serine/threonine-protein kinase